MTTQTTPGPRGQQTKAVDYDAVVIGAGFGGI
jgi:cation diffusion facilitator CzcD-associated flavoprotein CzcO